MAVRDFFWKAPVWRQKALSASPAVLEAIEDRGESFGGLIAVGPRAYGGTNERVTSAWVEATTAQYALVYASQPAVRTVVDYIARNVAQLALRLYERVGDNERRQRSDHQAVEAMRQPNDHTPGEQLIFNMVADWCVHHNAYLVKFRTGGADEPLTLYGLPAARVAILGAQYFAPEGYRIYRRDGSWLDLPTDDVIHWRGYNPTDPRIGISPLETLRKTLAEDAALQAGNVELAKQGFAPPGYIKRPLDAPPWTREASERFREDWANQQKDSGRHSPVLEEGMEFADFGFSPKDAQVLDGRRFTVETVANLYGLTPRLFGIGGSPSEQDQATFYQDVLPPITEMMCGYLDLGLLQAEYSLDDYYFEFDLEEKLSGSPSRLSSLTAAAGAPILTRNEARAKLNLPPKEKGDELIVPLNVAVGDPPKPSPQTMPVQDPNKPPQDGSYRTPATNGLKSEVEGLLDEMAHHRRLAEQVRDGEREAIEQVANGNDGQARAKGTDFVKRREDKRRRRDRYAKDMAEVFHNFYVRQERSLRGAESTKDGRLRLKAEFDLKRWVAELAAALLGVMKKTVEHEGQIAAARFGLGDFDMDRTEHYLEAVAERIAEDVNRVTQGALSENEPAAVFEKAKTQRAEAGGMDLATQMSNFAETTAAEQSPDYESRVKTWVVTSKNSYHPEMDGKTAKLGQRFSNGVFYPPYEHYGCQCLVDVT